MTLPIKTFALIALAGAAVLATPALAQVKLPPTLTATAYDTGTAGFNITVAIGKMMKDKYGTDMRVLPAGNDVARLQPLRQGRAAISGMGSGVYFAQEGVFEFGSKEWGPQAVQMTLTTVDCNAGTLGVAADTGLKTAADLKGKRVGFVVDRRHSTRTRWCSPAFAGLTEKDVKVVEFASYGAMWKGIINNDVDGLRHHHHRACQGGGNLAARPRLGADFGRRQGGLGTPAQGDAVHQSARCDLRRRRHLERTSRRSSPITRTRSTRFTPTRRKTTSTC